MGNDEDQIVAELSSEEGSLGALPAGAPESATKFEATSGEKAARENKRQRTKALLDKEKRVTVYIPDGTDEYASINGVTFIMKSGEEVSIPESVAVLLRNKWQAHSRANKSRQLDLGSL